MLISSGSLSSYTHGKRFFQCTQTRSWLRGLFWSGLGLKLTELANVLQSECAKFCAIYCGSIIDEFVSRATECTIKTRKQGEPFLAVLGLASMLTCCPSSQARNSRLAIRVETETTHDPDNIFLGDLERGSSKVPPAFPG